MTSVQLERLSISMEEGTVVGWLVEDGALVAAGEEIVEIETDKATATIEAPAAGRLEIVVAAGTIVPVETELARIVDPSAAPSAPAPPAPGPGAPAAPAASAPAPIASPAPAAPADVPAAAASPATNGADPTPADVPDPPSGGPRRRHGASPAAKRRAQHHGIALSEIAGTGPRGRIVIRDVLAAIAAREAAAAAGPAYPAGAATPGGPAHPLGAAAPAAPADPASATGTARPAAAPAAAPGRPRDLRSAVVASVTASWREIPHINIGGQLDGTGLAAAKKAARGRTASGGGPKVTATDLLIVALTKALRDVPELNGTLAGDGASRRSDAIHVALAVATEHSGVLAPVLRDAGDRSLEGIARERARLVAAAREQRLEGRDLAGATVTLSNLGLLPVDFFTPVISGPQLALIAIGRLAEVPVVRDGLLGVGHRMWVNAAIDHRGADGESGGRFLAAFERRLSELPAHV